jgi:hypothetical protein
VPPDRDLTQVIPRAPSDTGPLPAIACPRAGPCPGWRRAAAAALVLAWVTLALWAYALARIGLLFWEWR